ncbi:MAG: hypothetical protein ABI619_01085 [Betaproteobacteria bacterium]
MTTPLSRSPRPADPGAGSTPSACSVCGAVLPVPSGFDQAATAAFALQESAHCARLHEVMQQRHALAAGTQAGIVGWFGSDGVDTTDLIAHRTSLAQLDATLKTQAEELAKLMLHQPADKPDVTT